MCYKPDGYGAKPRERKWCESNRSRENNNQGVSLVSDEMANNSFRELNQKFIKIILYFIN